MSIPDKPKRTSLNEKVKFAFSLTDADLEANRVGQITEHQQVLIRQKRSVQIFFVMGAFALLVFMFVMLSSPSSPNRTRDVIDPVLRLLVIGITLATFVYTIYEFMLTTNDMNENRIIMSQGPVTLRIVRGKSTHYMVIVQDQRFTVTRDQLEAFIEGETYRLYHLPNSKTLMSAELIAQS